MKLEENIKSSKIKLYICMIIITIGCIGLAIPRLIDAINGKKLMIYFFIVYLCLPFLAYIFLKLISKKNDDMKYLKKKGTKNKGEIVEIRTVQGYKSYSSADALVVTVEDKYVLIFDVLENDAFRVLRMLLDEYPLKNQKTVPVDVYIYKNKVYVDLESVDLSKVEGYSEVLQILEKMNDEDSAKKE